MGVNASPPTSFLAFTVHRKQRWSGLDVVLSWNYSSSSDCWERKTCCWRKEKHMQCMPPFVVPRLAMRPTTQPTPVTSLHCNGGALLGLCFAMWKL